MINFANEKLFHLKAIAGRYKLSRYVSTQQSITSVLMYHGVENNSDKLRYRPLDVTFDGLANEIEFHLQQGYGLIDADTLFDHKERTHPAELIISFDDGHQNIREVVNYLFDRYQIRPLVAICPGIIETGTVFWFEEILARLLLTNSRALPPLIDQLNDAKTALRIILNHYFQGGAGNYRQLLEWMREVTADVNSDQVKNSHAVHANLSWDELKSMVDQNHCVIAAHGVFHEAVTVMNEQQFRHDITNCHSIILERIGIHCQHYVYPFGVHGNDWQPKALQQCGYKTGFVIEEQTNLQPLDSLFKLRRVTGHGLDKLSPGYYQYLWRQRHCELK